MCTVNMAGKTWPKVPRKVVEKGQLEKVRGIHSKVHMYP